MGADGAWTVLIMGGLFSLGIVLAFFGVLHLALAWGLFEREPGARFLGLALARIPSAAASSFWHRAGDLHAVGAAARDFRQGVRMARSAGRASQLCAGFFLSLSAESAPREPAL